MSSLELQNYMPNDTNNTIVENGEKIDRYINPSGATIERIKVWDESKESDTYLETKQLLDQWDKELSQYNNPLPPCLIGLTML